MTKTPAHDTAEIYAMFGLSSAVESYLSHRDTTSCTRLDDDDCHVCTRLDEQHRNLLRMTRRTPYACHVRVWQRETTLAEYRTALDNLR